MGQSPSDVRVSLVTGVHRNFVRRILAEPPRIAAAREQKKHRTARLLEAWYTDPAYLDSSGKPRDLSKKAAGAQFLYACEYLCAGSRARRGAAGTAPRRRRAASVR